MLIMPDQGLEQWSGKKKKQLIAWKNFPESKK